MLGVFIPLLAEEEDADQREHILIGMIVTLCSVRTKSQRHSKGQKPSNLMELFFPVLSSIERTETKQPNGIFFPVLSSILRENNLSFKFSLKPPTLCVTAIWRQKISILSANFKYCVLSVLL
jgi:hypothetical protein